MWIYLSSMSFLMTSKKWNLNSFPPFEKALIRSITDVMVPATRIRTHRSSTNQANHPDFRAWGEKNWPWFWRRTSASFMIQGTPTKSVGEMIADVRLTNLIQNQDFCTRKIWILERKSRFRGFRYWRFQIFRSRNEIREELEKTILEFSKSNFRG